MNLKSKSTLFHTIIERVDQQLAGIPLNDGEGIPLEDSTDLDMHIDAIKEQITRVPYDFPTLEINKEITDIDNFSIKDFKVVNYNSHPKIVMKMSA